MREAIRAVTFGLPESEAANARNILISMAETTGKRDAMVAEMVAHIRQSNEIEDDELVA